MIRACTLVILLLIAGCTRPEPPALTNVNPDWNPDGGFEQADALCRTKAHEVPKQEVMRGVYITDGTQMRQVYYSCMKGYGFELQSSTQPTV